MAKLGEFFPRKYSDSSRGGIERGLIFLESSDLLPFPIQFDCSVIYQVENLSS